MGITTIATTFNPGAGIAYIVIRTVAAPAINNLLSSWEAQGGKLGSAEPMRSPGHAVQRADSAYPTGVYPGGSTSNWWSNGAGFAPGPHG